MTRKIYEHPTPPTAPNGAIDIFAERETAVSAYRLTAAHGSDPPVELFDLDSHDTIDGMGSLEDIAAELGPVVFPDLAAYRAGTGWRLPAVLGALGVDAAELYEADLEALSSEDLDAEVLLDMLLLTDLWPDQAEQTSAITTDRLAWISRWTSEQMEAAAAWAGATHMHASDHDDVVIPPRPVFLDIERPT